MVIEVNVKQRKVEGGEQCSKRKNKWFLWKKIANYEVEINCRFQGNTSIPTDSPHFGDLCELRPEYERYLTPVDLKNENWDKGMSSLYIPANKLDIGENHNRLTLRRHTASIWMHILIFDNFKLFLNRDSNFQALS